MTTKTATTLNLLLLLLAATVAVTQAWQITTLLIRAYRGALMCVLPIWFIERAFFTVSAFYPAFVARRILQRHTIWPAFAAAGIVVSALFVAGFSHCIEWYSLAVVAIHLTALIWWLTRDVIHFINTTPSRANVA